MDANSRIAGRQAVAEVTEQQRLETAPKKKATDAAAAQLRALAA